MEDPLISIKRSVLLNILFNGERNDNFRYYNEQLTPADEPFLHGVLKQIALTDPEKTHVVLDTIEDTTQHPPKEVVVMWRASAWHKRVKRFYEKKQEAEEFRQQYTRRKQQLQDALGEDNPVVGLLLTKLAQADEDKFQLILKNMTNSDA